MKYYVSVLDGSRFGLLLGPFHLREEAESHVDVVRQKAFKLNERSWFYAFGTCGIKDYDKPGKLNQFFPDLIPSICK